MASLPLIGITWLFVAMVCAYGVAIITFGIEPLPARTTSRLLVGCSVLAILLCPLLVPAEHVRLRAIAALISVDITFKRIDSIPSDGRRITFGDFLYNLIPFPLLSVVYPDHKSKLAHALPRTPLLLRVAAGIAGFTAALLAVRSLAYVPIVHSSFSLNHLLMLPCFVLAVESGAHAVCALERLFGYDTAPIVHGILRSRTVGEFWRRFNNRVHDWLHRNIFRHSGGEKTPIRSLFLVFFVSAVLHEVMFAVATGRITGYQFAFFMLQAPAVLASRELDRRSRASSFLLTVTRGLTLLFLATTSVLFFDGVSDVFSFIYVSESILE